MFGSEILEVAIGLIFVFLIVSVICSAVREGIESIVKTRAAYLEYGIRELLHDKGAIGIARAFYTHPLINSLYSNEYSPGPRAHPPGVAHRGRNLPSYIPARNFALALMDMAARGSSTLAASSDASSPTLSLASVRANVANLENPYVQRAVLAAIDSAQGDMDRAVANLGAWYDSAMDRVSGAYKRATQKILFVIALIVAVALNVDAITIADYLYRNDSARAAIVARAETAARDSNLIKQGSTAAYTAARAELDSLQLPIGWDRTRARWPWTDSVAVAPDGLGNPARMIAVSHGWWNGLFSPAVGWLVTALAASMGAPFWFDILNKVMVIRSTVKPHEKSREESSEDRQAGSAKQPKTMEDNAVGDPQTDGGAGHAAASAPPAEPPGPTLPPRPSPGDPENAVDGCDASVDRPTEDDELPAAFGGVA